MYIYQNGKLYCEKNGKLMGVEIYPHKVVLVAHTKTEFLNKFSLLTTAEVFAKFHITDENPYIFPLDEVVVTRKTVEEKVEENGTIGHAKIPTRGRPRK